MQLLIHLPDIKQQIHKKIKSKVSTMFLYTHEHADQTSGIFELRIFLGRIKKLIFLLTKEP